MKVFAIGDLHLSFTKSIIIDNWENVEEYKSMSIFGDNWREHYRKIYYNWRSKVTENDIVLIPGDISWASNLDELKPDLEFINMLPGKKVFIRGNHDYWWQSITKLRSFFPENCYLIQNDIKTFRNIIIAGSRGWTVPNEYQYTEHDEKIYNREVTRLELSLKKIQKADTIIVMMHYMPVNEKHQYNEIIKLLEKYNVDICLYGHLHDKDSHKHRIEGLKWGIEFKLVSADFINFNPLLIIEKKCSNSYN